MSAELGEVRELLLQDQSAEGANGIVDGVLVYKETEIAPHSMVYGTFFEGRYVVICISKTDARQQRMFNFKVGEKPTMQFIMRGHGFPNGMTQYQHYLILGPESSLNDIATIRSDLGIDAFAQIFWVRSLQPVHNACISYDALSGLFFAMDSRDGTTIEQQLPLPAQISDEVLQQLKEYIEKEFTTEKRQHLLSFGMPVILRKILKAHDKEEIGLLAADEMKNADLFESQFLSEVCDVLQNLQYATYSTAQALEDLKHRHH